MRPLAVGLLLPLLALPQVHDAPENRGAAAAHHALKRLPTTVRVLMITAHPDDEDAALLAWLSRAQGYRVGLLSLNRGEGGANLIGSEMYDALGLLRTEELLAATRGYGVDLFFTRVTDFGFSKRLDETLEHWGPDTALGDAMRVVRSFRPDIVIGRFQGKARDGHGNHQAAGHIAQQVFAAAADANRFPEHFKEGLRPWQVKKAYHGVRDNEPATHRLPVGDYDPLYARSYREIGREAYNLHRSQFGGGSRPPRGAGFSTIELTRTTLPRDAATASLTGGLQTTITSLTGSPTLESMLAAIQREAEAALAAFDARRPATALPHVARGLRSVREAISRLPENTMDMAVSTLLHRLQQKERDFEEAGHRLLGLSLEVLADAPPPPPGIPAMFAPKDTFAVAIPGQQFTLTASLVNRGGVPVSNVRLSLRAPQAWTISGAPSTQPQLGDNEEAKARFTVTVPADAPPTRPYWSRRSFARDHVYQLDQPQFLNLPHAPPELVGVAEYVIDGVPFTLTQPAQTVATVRPYGEQRRLLVVAPALSVTLSSRQAVVRTGAGPVTIPLQVEVLSNAKGKATGTLKLELPAGWSSEPASVPLSFSQEGERRSHAFTVRVPSLAAGQEANIQAVAEMNGRQYREGYQTIAARDLEPRHLYTPASVAVRGVEVAVRPNLKVGYIMGVGDEVPQSLQQIGVPVTMLGPPDLATGDLSRFDTIVVGIRASAVRDDLRAYYRRLLDYAEQGGNLVVQYQTQEFDAAPYGPYPFQLTRRAEEVSEEDAPVAVLAPDHPLFTTPNRIPPADFTTWVEERGSKFMMEWDPRYTPLIESHDRGDQPQKGGWLYARHGKGHFTYCAYAFYRQLPAGVPGAYRLFANLISLGRPSQP